MGKIGNIANGGVIQGPLGLRPSAVLTGDIRISNRKSGIRIHPKPPEVSEVQISNRKYSPLLPSPWRTLVSIPRLLRLGALSNLRFRD